MAGFREAFEAVKRRLRSEKLFAIGGSFVAFANTQPRLLELMYESELTTPELDPALHVYQHAGHQNLVNIMKEAGLSLDDREANLRAITYWSCSITSGIPSRQGWFSPPGPTRCEAQRQVRRPDGHC